MSRFEILPAIDVKGGKAVRLIQGELSAETQYGERFKLLKNLLLLARDGYIWLI